MGLGVKPGPVLWMSDGGAIGIASSLEVLLMETRHGLWQCWWWFGWLVCSAQGQCASGEVQRTHGAACLEMARMV